MLAAAPRTAVPNLPTSDRVRARPDVVSTLVLATAVYVTGTTNLQPGQRYGIGIRESRLQILGPTEIDPLRVVLDRPIAGVDAKSVEGRLVLSHPNGLLLAFMAVAGPATSDLAASITRAARSDVG